MIFSQILLRLGSFSGSAEYTPSTLVPLRRTSAPISTALSAEAVSVVKNGFPVPPERMQYCSFFQFLNNLVPVVKFSNRFHPDGSENPGFASAPYYLTFQGEAVDYSGKHAHLVALYPVETRFGTASPRKIFPPPITTAASQPSLTTSMNLARHIPQGHPRISHDYLSCQ